MKKNSDSSLIKPKIEFFEYESTSILFSKTNGE
jgi:hypothetical protein